MPCCGTYREFTLRFVLFSLICEHIIESLMPNVMLSNSGRNYLSLSSLGTGTSTGMTVFAFGSLICDLNKTVAILSRLFLYIFAQASFGTLFQITLIFVPMVPVDVESRVFSLWLSASFITNTCIHVPIRRRYGVIIWRYFGLLSWTSPSQNGSKVLMLWPEFYGQRLWYDWLWRRFLQFSTNPVIFTCIWRVRFYDTQQESQWPFRLSDSLVLTFLDKRWLLMILCKHFLQQLKMSNIILE